ncbi:transcriptional regulator SlyA [Isoptericola halotolerans]|uniref:DNA-binding MarR family transcriptional regulator n=1 Tax=Isoptericola halotolerans TaxID=300560 RepID=A0ABX1ZZN1_9MICO|nr:MarR family transcriptional regulator [Isoptericola halotolerans]NOV96053.1 DNA-binding MarR family transcriptional regulator [Isoptericola halotolerans]
MPSPDAPSPFGWSLAALLREWKQRVAATCSELPQGSRGYEVLSAVVHDEPPTQAALAARLGIDRTVMTYLLDELDAAGLARRQPDPSDRRARRIVATARGREIVTGLDGAVARAEDELLSTLDPAERATLRTLLERAAGGAAPHDDRCAVVGDTIAPGT